MATKRGVHGLTLATPGWIFLVTLLVGLVFAIPADLMFEKTWRLQMGGVTVQGQVNRLWTSQSSCGKDNLDTCTSYNVDFSFDSGAWRQTQTTVTSIYYDTLTEGGPIAVRYVMDDPTIFEVETGWSFFQGVIFFVFAAILVVGSGYGLRWRWRLARRLVTLRETGERRQAKVTGLVPTNTTVNGSRLYRLQWRDEDGVEGQSQGWPQAKLPGVGATVTIYADRQGNLPPVWEGDCGAR